MNITETAVNDYSIKSRHVTTNSNNGILIMGYGGDNKCKFINENNLNTNLKMLKIINKFVLGK